MMRRTMLAVHFERAGTIVREVAPPAPAPGETRIRVLRAGICATDLALRRGYMGFQGVPGHEFVGVALNGPLVGRRVVGEINAGCGLCAQCAAGDPRHCPARTVLGILGRPGCFAEEISLPSRNLHAVPDGIADEEAVFTEPLAAAFAIPQQVPIAPGLRTLVAGDGRLGLLCAHVLARHGADVSVGGRHPERADLLPGGVLHAPLSDCKPHSFDLAVEATGRPDGLAAVASLVRPRGTIVLKTTCEQPVTLDFAPIVVDELTLVGSRCGPFGPALAELARGTIPLAGWIAARYALRDVEHALAHAARPGTLKILLEP